MSEHPASDETLVKAEALIRKARIALLNCDPPFGSYACELYEDFNKAFDEYWKEIGEKWHE